MRKFSLLLLLAVNFCAVGAEPAELVQPREIHRVVADGKHNAFTALVKWQDAYWLAFRKAAEHNSADGDIVVLRSTDAQTWTEAHRLNVVPDDRDPQFLATDKRLFLYDAGMLGEKLTTYVTYTEDGKSWSKPQTVYEPRFIVWKPIENAGRFYAGAHLKSESGSGKDRMVHLVTSTDGLKWEKFSQIRAGNWESETTLHFPAKGRITAFLRQKYGSPESEILEATAPYDTWTARPAGVHLSGHIVHVFEGVTYLMSRTRQGKEMGTMVYVYQDEKLLPYCKIPSGGDCSYAEAVPLGREMLVSYYSSHEGATNIYTCRIPLK